MGSHGVQDEVGSEVEDVDEDTEIKNHDVAESQDETDSASYNIDLQSSQAQISNTSSPTHNFKFNFVIETPITESSELSKSVSNANEKINQDSTNDGNKSLEILKLDENKTSETSNADTTPNQSKENNYLENISSFDTPDPSNVETDSKETKNESESVNNDDGRKEVVLKCSQGFGFFVS